MVQPNQRILTRLQTRLLLVEADPRARNQHALALRTAGYEVVEAAGLPSPEEIEEADLIIADDASFQWLQSQPTGREQPFVVLTDSVRAGVTACLSGAADWTPVGGDTGYLLTVVAEVCREHSLRY